jgi:nitrate reductase gamma subunit
VIKDELTTSYSLLLITHHSSLYHRFGYMRILGIIFGIVIAAVGGVIAYRAFFLEPSAAIVITNTEVRELPNTFRILGGIALLVVGAGTAFLAARRKT